MQIDMNKLKYFLKQFAPISEMYGKKAVLVSIEESLDVLSKKTSVLFCGEFKRGKSSLINALLKDNLCPTDIGIATAVVTRIMFGPTKKAIRYYGNALLGVENLKTEEISWEDIAKYTVGDVLDIDYTVQMDLYYPSDFLKDGIVIIDTPGIGGLDPRHGTLTKSALQSADVAVFITDASEPVTQSEVDFYKEYVLSNCPHNVILVNKADELVSEELKTHIDTTKRTLISGINAEVLPVSAMNWLMYNQFSSVEFKDNSHCDDVLRGISNCVDSFRKEQLVKLRDALVSEIESVLENVAEEKGNLHADEAEQDQIIERLQKQMAELVAFRKEISNPTSPIRLRVDAIYEDVRNEVLSLLSHESIVLTTTTFDSLIDSENGLSNDGKWLVAQINDRIQDLSCKINTQTRDAFNKISADLDKEMPSVFATSSYGVSDNLKTHDPFNSQLAFSVAGKLAQGGIIAAATAIGVEWLMPAAISSVIPGVGWIVGLATAGALIWKRLTQENEQQKKMKIRQQVLPNINIALTDLRNQTNNQFTKFRQGLLETLQVMITEAETRLKSLQNSIENSRVSKKKLADMRSTIEQRERFLHTLAAQCKLIYSKPYVPND